MPLVVVLGVLLSLTFQPDCSDVTSCRQAAVEAHSRGDFEAFHDLAWRAVQKGPRNNPELMTLLARAQSLSGRPGDALVMLRRLAQLSVAVEVGDDDFRRVRDLAAWPEVAALFEAKKSGEKTAPPPPEPPKPAAPERAAVVVAPERPVPTKPAPREEKPEPAKAAPEKPPTRPSDEEEALPEAMASIQPAGLAYDGVSRRFIVGDRRENKLVVFDEVFKRANNMVAAGSAGFFGLTAIEIDAKRGDLWIVNSGEGRGASLHKLQLVSGRVLFELSVPAELGPTSLVDAAVLGDGTVLLLDAEGRRILELLPSGRSFKRAATVDVEGATSVASTGGPVAYVAHRKGMLRVDLAAGTAAPVRGAPSGLLRLRADGARLLGVQPAANGHRIVRLRLDPAGRKVAQVDVLDKGATVPGGTAMTVVDDSLYYLTSANGGAVLRRVRLRK